MNTKLHGRDRQPGASDPVLHHGRPGQRLMSVPGALCGLPAGGRVADRRPGLRRRLVPRSLAGQGDTALHPRPDVPRQGRFATTNDGNKRRNRIEIYVRSSLKDWRRIATRYDRCPKVFLSAIALAAAVMSSGYEKERVLTLVINSPNRNPWGR